MASIFSYLSQLIHIQAWDFTKATLLYIYNPGYAIELLEPFELRGKTRHTADRHDPILSKP
jgi:hypothetical protein